MPRAGIAGGKDDEFGFGQIQADDFLGGEDAVVAGGQAEVVGWLREVGAGEDETREQERIAAFDRGAATEWRGEASGAEASETAERGRSEFGSGEQPFAAEIVLEE